MIEDGLRWARRLGRLARRAVLSCLVSSGAGLWFFPYPHEDPFAEANQHLNGADENFAYDPRELDAWLREVLGEAGKHD